MHPSASVGERGSKHSDHITWKSTWQTSCQVRIQVILFAVWSGSFLSVIEGVEVKRQTLCRRLQVWSTAGSYEKPFPTDNKSAADDAYSILAKKQKSLINVSLITEELETLRLKQKLLIFSNFYFGLNVFKSPLLQRRQKASIGGKVLKIVAMVFLLAH